LVEAPLIGRSLAHRRLLARIERIAPTDAEVLITGPTGVGKELYAIHVHHRSTRAQRAFVPINCGAIPSDLFENELFGHVGGAFTGARQHRAGLVEEAEGGTLFLDEIDSLSLPCQVKLLRLLQEREYRRLGESRTRRANVRIVAATNADLVVAVRERRMREDLFFRLRVCPLDVPALRARPDDIEPLLDEYTTRYACAYRLPAIILSPAALERLRTYAWPGNVRELENCVRYLTCLQLSRSVGPEDLPLLDDALTGRGGTGDRRDEPHEEEELADIERPMRDAKRQLVLRFERQYLDHALRATSGNIAHAARRSGKARRAFFELMRKHGLRAADYTRACTTRVPAGLADIVSVAPPVIALTPQ
jgi:two-component system, NtrC family, response regulator GlrR